MERGDGNQDDPMPLRFSKSDSIHRGAREVRYLEGGEGGGSPKCKRRGGKNQRGGGGLKIQKGGF